MNLKEVYVALEGNYEDVLSRLLREKTVIKFVKRFPSESYMTDLVQALASDNTEDSFRYAHIMKGVCKNLSFDRLANSSSAMTEELRAGKLEAGKAMLDQVKADYELTCKAISQLEE